MGAHYTVKFTPKARADVRAIAEYIALESPSNAADFVGWLEDEVMSLEDYPRRCPVARESDLWGLEVRVLLVGAYRVLYTVRRSVVYVIRVRHGARDEPRTFND
jgi:toxin ParE1/3/4